MKYESRRFYETIQSIQYPSKNLTAFNYTGLNLNETPKEFEEYTLEFQTFWDKECRENPTNKNCLIYCD